MCTVLTYTTGEHQLLFGRNMDLEYEFGQTLMAVPRQYQGGTYGIMAMGTVYGDIPLLADGFNEKGLCCAGLNFPGYASYPLAPKDGDTNVPVYDFTRWVLATFGTVAAFRQVAHTLRIIDKPVARELPSPTLHWILADEQECVVVESTFSGVHVYDNPVGTLTNSPGFPYHLSTLSQYTHLTHESPSPVCWNGHSLPLHGVGAGLIGLPGDATPNGRFVRGAYYVSRKGSFSTTKASKTAMFHMLDNLAMVPGTVYTPDGLMDKTIYTAVMSPSEYQYHLKTYENFTIETVTLEQKHLDATELVLFPF